MADVWVANPPDNTGLVVDIVPHDFSARRFCVMCGGALDLECFCTRCGADHFTAWQRLKKEPVK